MRYGFVTCVELGLSCIRAINDLGIKLDLVVTLKDEIAPTKSGRVFLDEFCSARDIPLLKVKHINDAETLRAIRDRDLDYLFIVGWSQIAGPEVVAAPRRGCLGMHPTLLPEGRGRASIPWAILKGLRRTGVTLFRLDAKVDNGPILAQQTIPLPDRCDATWLYDRVNAVHIELIKDVMPRLEAAQVVERIQDESAATYWPGRKPADGQIDLAGSVFDAERMVRAVTHPYPGAFYLDGDAKVVVWRSRIVDRPGTLPTLQFKDGLLECLETGREPGAAL